MKNGKGSNKKPRRLTRKIKNSIAKFAQGMDHRASTRTSSVRVVNEHNPLIVSLRLPPSETNHRTRLPAADRSLWACVRKGHVPNLPGKITFCQEAQNCLFLLIRGDIAQDGPAFALLAVQHQLTEIWTVNPPRWYRRKQQSHKTYLGIKYITKLSTIATLSHRYREKL
jgi:hypothetical protein